MCEKDILVSILSSLLKSSQSYQCVSNFGLLVLLYPFDWIENILINDLTYPTHIRRSMLIYQYVSHQLRHPRVK